MVAISISEVNVSQLKRAQRMENTLFIIKVNRVSE